MDYNAIMMRVTDPIIETVKLIVRAKLIVTAEEDLCWSKMTDSKNNGHYFSTVDDLMIQDRAISNRDFKSMGREIEILQTALRTRIHS